MQATIDLHIESEDELQDVGFSCSDEQLEPWPLPQIHTSESHFDTDTFQQDVALHEQLPAGLLIGKRYQIIERIGCGSFGAAYLAKDTCSGHKVVLKTRVSDVNGADESDGTLWFSNNLEKEFDIYMRLGAAPGVASQGGQVTPLPGIPEVFAAGVHKLWAAHCTTAPVFVSYIVMQSLGPSLWRICHPRNSQKTTEGSAHVVPPSSDQDYGCWVGHTGKGMLQALASMHAMGYMHRDVKTENFCVEGNSNTGQGNGSVFIIDMGFARQSFGYYDFDTYGRPHASFWGTPNYSSLRSLLRHPQTPRDDLEALVYCLLELELRHAGCFLPWNATLTTDSEAAAGWSDEQLETMMKKKRAAWTAACKQGLVPGYLQDYFNYITRLQARHAIDYQWLLACLDSRVSGKPPSSKPQAMEYQDWPDTTKPYDRHWAAASVLQQSQEAAASIVAGSAVMTQRQPMQQQLPSGGVQPAAYQEATESDQGELSSQEEGTDQQQRAGASAGWAISSVLHTSATVDKGDAARCSPSLCIWGALGVCEHLSQPNDERDTATAKAGETAVDCGVFDGSAVSVEVCGAISRQDAAELSRPTAAQVGTRKRVVLGLLQTAQQVSSAAETMFAADKPKQVEVNFPGFKVSALNDYVKKQRQE